MKELLVALTRYNVWANTIICNLLEGIEESVVNNQIHSSFGTIRKTVEHIWMAESVWMQRLQMTESITLPNEAFTGSFKDVCKEWLQCSNNLLDFTAKIKDQRGFDHQFHYHSLKKELCKSTVAECIQHICNHSTFHRGQLIHFLRQEGVDKIPSTDFITFTRLKK